MRPGSVGAREERRRSRHRGERLAAIGIPGRDRVDLLAAQDLRRVVGLRSDERHVLRVDAVLLAALLEEELLDERELETQLLALEVLERLDARAARRPCRCRCCSR